MLAKRFFFACAGLLCLALAYHFGAVTAQAQGNTRTSSFDLIKTRRLAIVDEQGAVRIKLGSENGTTALLLNDAAGKIRVGLSVNRSGTPVVSVHGEDGGVRALLTSADSGASLVLVDNNGQQRMDLMLGSDGDPSVMLMDEASKIRTIVSESLVTLADKEGQVLWRAPK